MSIPLPNLDDRRYQDLLDEARALIPHLYPEWTDHNSTDPGMILIELLAWLTETVLYRLDQISEPHYRVFLKLLNGPDGATTDLDLQTAIRQTVLTLRERHRAVTPQDFEYLILQVWPQTEVGKRLNQEITRAHCVPGRNLALPDQAHKTTAPGHMSLVVVTQQDADHPQPSPALLAEVWRFLDERRLLTTRHHVVGPHYVAVKITANLYLENDALPDHVRARAVKALADFFHPLTGGFDGEGWPFGRPVYVSEVYQLLDQVAGVDYVTKVKLEAPNYPDRVRHDDTGELTSILLDAHELVMLQIETADLTVVERIGES